MLTAKKIRKKNKAEKQPCVICGKHREIAELHHVVPYKDMVCYLNWRFIDEVETPLVWLCPVHHKYIHLMLNNPIKFAENVTEEDLSKKEIKKLWKLYDDRIKWLRKALEKKGEKYEF